MLVKLYNIVVINRTHLGLDETIVVVSAVNPERHGGGVEQHRKIGTGGRDGEAVEDDGSTIVCSGSVLGSGKGVEPLAGMLTWLSNLSDPLAPTSLQKNSKTKILLIQDSTS